MHDKEQPNRSEQGSEVPDLDAADLADRRLLRRRMLLWPLPGVIMVVLAITVNRYPPAWPSWFDWHLCSDVLESLGAALIAAGIAVPAMELKAHDRLIRHVRQELKPVAHQLAAVLEVLKTLADAESEKALSAVLLAAFRDTPEEARLFTRTWTLVKAVKTLRANGSWIDDVALKFIGELLFYASQNAMNLSVAATKGGIETLELPRTSALLAGNILAKQMDAMNEGDEYIVLSDLSTWRTGLDNFYESTLAAVRRGVRVKRLFCPHGHDGKLTDAEARAIIEKHWVSATRPEYCDGNGRPVYELGVVSNVFVKDRELHHAGIFRHAGQGVAFEPYYSDLSVMRFTKTDAKEPSDMTELWNKAVLNFKRRDDNPGMFATVPFETAWNALGTSWWRA